MNSKLFASFLVIVAVLVNELVCTSPSNVHRVGYVVVFALIWAETMVTFIQKKHP